MLLTIYKFPPIIFERKLEASDSFLKFVWFLILVLQRVKMKKFLVLALMIFSITSYAQELDSSTPGKMPDFPKLELLSLEETFIGPWQNQTPALSMPVAQLPERHFTISEVDFSKKEVKRQVNLVAMMERKRYEKEEALVELDSPLPTLSSGEKALIEVTNDIRRHDRSSNYDIYTGEKKIPAYQEMSIPLFRSPYNSRSGVRAYVSPGTYRHPYLR